MPRHDSQWSTTIRRLPDRQRGKPPALFAVVLVLLVAASLLLGGSASAEEPVPRVGLPEQPLNEQFAISNTDIGVPVITDCQNGEQIRFTFVADSPYTALYVADNESTFTVWQQGPLGLDPIAQYCDSGPNDTPISVGYHQGGGFSTNPGERYWVSTWFDDGTESIVINPSADNPFINPGDAPRLSYNTPDVVDSRGSIGWGTEGAPADCPPFSVYRQFYATSPFTRLTVEDNEVSVNVWSVEDGALTCNVGGPIRSWTYLSDAQIEAVLPDVPDAVALNLSQTTLLRTEPGQNYYIGWSSEDRFEGVVITDDTPSVGDLPALELGVVDLVREAEPYALADAARDCIEGLPVRRTFVASSDVTQLTVTDNEVSVQVWHADDGDPAHCSQNGSWASLSPGDLGPIDDSVFDGTGYSTSMFGPTMRFETIPGDAYLIAWSGEDSAEGVVLTDGGDLPAEVSVQITCRRTGSGDLAVSLFNPGPSEAEYEVTIGDVTTLRALGSGSGTAVYADDQPNGYLPVTVERNGSPKATFDPTVACDDVPIPEIVDLTHGVAAILNNDLPGFPNGAARDCINALPLRARFVAESDVTRLTTTDDEVVIQVWHADDGDPAFCSVRTSWGSLTDANRDALLGGIDDSALAGFGYEYDDFFQTLTFDTIPGQEYLVAWASEDPLEAIVITDSTDPTEASVTISCLGGNGRVDVNLFNPGPGDVQYDVRIGNLSRSVTVGPRERGRVSMTGRPDGYLPVTVNANVWAKATFDPIVQCDEDVKFVSEPEVRVVNACQNGLGFVFFQFANPLDVQRSYIIRFEGVDNRSTTARAHGAAVRGVSGRPPGVYDVQIVADNSPFPVYEGSVEVIC